MPYPWHHRTAQVIEASQRMALLDLLSKAEQGADPDYWRLHGSGSWWAMQKNPRQLRFEFALPHSPSRRLHRR